MGIHSSGDQGSVNSTYIQNQQNEAKEEKNKSPRLSTSQLKRKFMSV